MNKRQDPIARFWKYTDRRSDWECWPWKGHIDRLGYGVFYLGDKSINAHRISFEIAYEKPAPGQHVLHRCDNRACVNPGHLRVGTHHDNMIDMAKKGRANKRLTIADVLAIRSMDATHGYIATLFGVSQSTITRIRLRQRRQHI